MRWEETAEEAMKSQGFEVIASDGQDDYSGYGVTLGRKEGLYATLSWSYGSCSWCDHYEDMSPEERLQAFVELIDTWTTEEEARRKFNDSKGW